MIICNDVIFVAANGGKCLYIRDVDSVACFHSSHIQ